MTPELTALATLVAIQVVFGLTVSAIVATRTGPGYILSSREEKVDLDSGFIGRMHRARVNAFEAIIYMTPTVTVLHLSGAANTTTAYAAWIFVAARLGFILCYALDLTPWRSFVWLIGLGAIATMLGVALL